MERSKGASPPGSGGRVVQGRLFRSTSSPDPFLLRRCATQPWLGSDLVNGVPALSDFKTITVTVTSATPVLLGDANGDGVVDDEDASILGADGQQQSGATWAMGDFNDDGKVNDLDAAILAAHWTMPPPEAEPVAPSPPAGTPVRASSIGPHASSELPATRLRLSDPRKTASEAAHDAAFAEAVAQDPLGQERLAMAWSYEAARQSARQHSTALPNRLAVRRAVDLLILDGGR